MSGITDLGRLDAETLARFIAWLGGRYTDVGKSNILYTLRDLFSCPGVLRSPAFDPKALITNLHTPKHGVVPSVYTREEVAMALSAIDRETDAGRTLYLVVMLAAVYGLRSRDIKELRIGDIDWALPVSSGKHQSACVHSPGLHSMCIAISGFASTQRWCLWQKDE